jgi:hypothetical protein
MAQETTKSGKLGSLQRLRASLAATASETPHLEGPRGRFDKIVGEAEEVAKQQAAFIASKQEATQRLKILLTEGERVADGIRKFLREHYGVRSERLAEFGLKPLRARRKSSAEEPDPTEIPGASKPSKNPASPAKTE